MLCSFIQKMSFIQNKHIKKRTKIEVNKLQMTSPYYDKSIDGFEWYVVLWIIHVTSETVGVAERITSIKFRLHALFPCKNLYKEQFAIKLFIYTFTHKSVIDIDTHLSITTKNWIKPNMRIFLVTHFLQQV